MQRARIATGAILRSGLLRRGGAKGAGGPADPRQAAEDLDGHEHRRVLLDVSARVDGGRVRGDRREDTHQRGRGHGIGRALVLEDLPADGEALDKVRDDLRRRAARRVRTRESEAAGALGQGLRGGASGAHHDEQHGQAVGEEDGRDAHHRVRRVLGNEATVLRFQGSGGARWVLARGVGCKRGVGWRVEAYRRVEVGTLPVVEHGIRRLCASEDGEHADDDDVQHEAVEEPHDAADDERGRHRGIQLGHRGLVPKGAHGLAQDEGHALCGLLDRSS